MRFGRFIIDRARLVLEYEGATVALAPKSVELLCVLLRRSGETVSKRELLDELWPESAVEEANLSQHVYLIRKALRSCGDGTAAVITVPKRGYRLIVEDRPGEAGIYPAVTPVPPLVPAAAPAEVAPVVVRRAEERWRRPARMCAIATMLLFIFLAAAGAPPRPRVIPALSASGRDAARLGRYHLDLRTATGIARSREYFAQVIASDPKSPTGYAGLADAYTMSANYQVGTLRPAAYLRRAAATARYALALDPRSAEALTAVGAVAENLHDTRSADTDLRRAIAFDPAYAPAHHWLGTLLFERGEFVESARELTIASHLNPVSTATSAWLEMAAYFSHRYTTAIEHGRRAMELDPARYDTLRELGLAYEAQGDYRSALAVFERIPKGSSQWASVPYLVAAVYARSGRPQLALRILTSQRRRNVVDSELPFALLALGQPAQAARAAKRVALRDCLERRLFTADPRFDGVRGDAAFGALFSTRCVANG